MSFSTYELVLLSLAGAVVLWVLARLPKHFR